MVTVKSTKLQVGLYCDKVVLLFIKYYILVVRSPRCQGSVFAWKERKQQLISQR